MPQKPYALSVKAVVRNEAGEVLLLRRGPASKANAGKWDFPGGKVDPGERLDEALSREVFEETGLAVALGRVAGSGDSERADRRIAYLFIEARAESGTVHLSPEHDQYAWVAPDKLTKADVAPQFHAFLAAYAQGIVRA